MYLTSKFVYHRGLIFHSTRLKTPVKIIRIYFYQNHLWQVMNLFPVSNGLIKLSQYYFRSKLYRKLLFSFFYLFMICSTLFNSVSFLCMSVKSRKFLPISQICQFVNTSFIANHSWCMASSFAVSQSYFLKSKVFHL